MKILFIIILLFSIVLSVYAQDRLRDLNRGNIADQWKGFNYIPKRTGHYTAEEWATVIDSTWGPGLPLDQKLAIFDEAWNKIDAEFAAFQGLDIDWDSLGTFYRNQIDSSTSRGRFSAIMSYMILALEESHSWVYDAPVLFTPLKPGVPLLYLGGNYENTSHFGATLTPLPDSSLLVLKTVSNHPLGLAAGDIVLGYDGKLWKNLIKELISFQLPIYLGWGIPASDKISNSHNLLCGAGMNWHLFDTLDVVKYPTGDILHYPTELLAGQNEFIWGNEQLPIPGVDWIYNGTDNIMDPFGLGDYISWGLVDSTNIGYIYAAAWISDIIVPGLNISQQFYDAIYNLMFVYHVDGLIIDQRFGLGGVWQYQQGLSLLFNSTFQLFAFDERSNPDNHYQMSHYDWPDQFLITQGDPVTLFDRPIANLIGPATWSCGEMAALVLKFHPMSRLFGKPTNGGFSTSTWEYNLSGNTDWFMSHTNSNCYLLENPGVYLAHHALFPDEEVWLTQEDVAKVEDTVVKRAIEWIQNLSYAHTVKVDKLFAEPGADSINVTALVENPNEHQISVTSTILNQDSTITDQLNLFDDGLHGDGDANDNLWGNFYTPIPDNEEHYKVSVITDDLTDETSRTLPNVAWFTTIGPLVFTGDLTYNPLFDSTFHSGNRVRFKIHLRNESSSATATDVQARLTSSTPLITLGDSLFGFPDIAPGASTESFGYYDVSISGDIHPDTVIYLPIIVYSHDYPLWSDSMRLDVISAIEDDKHSKIPTVFALRQNYPNPFNPVTMINYQLPKSSDLEISIYNLLGQKVATLVNERQQAGYHKVQWDASGFASGVYYYRIEAGEFVDIKKMVLLR